MQSRNLPAKSEEPTVSMQSAFLLAATAILQIVFVNCAIGAFTQGDTFSAVLWLAMSLGYLWSTAAFYISVPVTLYFQSKYRRNCDFIALDRVHRRAAALLKILPCRKTLALETTLSNLGLVRLCQGDYESAEHLFAEAVASLQKNRAMKNSSSMIVLQNNLGVAYVRQNKLVEAELQAAKALELAQLPQNQKRNKILMGPPLALHAVACLRLGETESAIQFYRQAIDAYASYPVPRYHMASSYKHATAFAQLGLAIANMRLGHKEESLQWFDKAWQILVQYPASLNTMVLECLNMLANEYMNNKLFEEAERLLEVGYSIGYHHPFHPDSKQILNYYEKLLLLTNRQSEVDDMRSWLRPLINPLALPGAPARIASEEAPKTNQS